MAQTRVVMAWRDVPAIRSFDGFRKQGGYEAFLKAARLTPDELIELVKASGLRGRGGAGFPTGLKWSFVPRNSGKPKYLCVNADESEPGTCKDREIIENLPHQLIEGILICCHAVGIEKAFIYIRGEMLEGYQVLKKAVDEAYQQGFLGQNIQNTGINIDVVVHRGAGAYICGEESALLTSIEGGRGFPRLRPPFPAVEGLYACPTVINNVETIATLPAILRHGAAWYAAMGTEKSKGTRLISLSGHVKRPGNYEIELGKVTFRDLIYSPDLGGGMLDDLEPKAIIPGGASAPFLIPAEHLDVPLDFEAIAAAGSMAGSGAVVIISEKTCIVSAVLNLVEFFHEESCGKCTPCREGTGWLVQLLKRVKHGEATEHDLEVLFDVCDNILGKAFCPLGDSATAPVTSGLHYFREEFRAFLKGEKEKLKEKAPTP
ncbi:MAG: NADH-quinone oxidoreductase subunit NuoF [Armatimonadetes bacterium]|nr:NADH-quinone oxidoreductase subunit NuoF [Armatimonadota bacterium]